MNRKVLIYVFTFLFLLYPFITGTPDSVHAESTSVIDWIDEEENESQGTDEGTDTVVTDVEERSIGGIIGQLFLYTLLIIVMIYGLIKFLSLRQKNLQPNQAVQLLGGTSLGNNKSLQIVKIGGKMYVLGVADSINLIKEITNEEDIEKLEQDLRNQPTNITKSLFGLTRTKDDSLGPSDSKGAFQQLFNQSLMKQKKKQEQLNSDLFESNQDKEGRS